MQRSKNGRKKRVANGNCHSTNDNNNVPIRTVYVAPIKPIIVNMVKTYFEKFGEVEDVRLHARTTFQYGFVQFKMAETASTVLSQEWHQIGDCNVKVKAADLWHQPEFKKESDPMLIIPDQESPLHMLNALNEDCLRAIFERMNVKTLINAAEVCVRFNKHAKEVFAKKYKEFELCNVLKAAEMKSLFKNFGSTICSLKVDNSLMNSINDFACAVNEHSTAQLRNLELASFDIKGKFAKKLRPLFKTLESLRLECCQLKGGTESLFNACTDLKKLTLIYCEVGKGNIIKHKFKKLEEAEFVETIDLSPGLIGFVKLNPTLKKLKVDDSGVDLPKFVQAIGVSLFNLNELDIEEFGDDDLANYLPALSKLTLLKVLKLNFNSVPIANLMKNLVEKNVPIEHLKIVDGGINSHAIDSISKLTKIRVLEFVDIEEKLTDDNMVQLAKALPELQELGLMRIESELTTIGLKKMISNAKKLSLLVLESIDSIVIDFDDYKTMLKIVQCRNEKVKLLIKLTSSGDKVKVPDDVLAENREIFYIDENIEEEDDTEELTSFSDEDSYDDWFDDSDYHNEYFYSDVDSEEGFAFDGRYFFLG